MKKLNKNGFTLIELLAVITIMGILILVAIPTISRTIENSRKDTFIDIAKQYVSGAKNMWIADDLVCSVDGSAYTPSAVPAGAYYIPVDTANSDDLPVLLEQGGKSSWGKRDVKGYILVYVSEDVFGNNKISYYPVLVDGVHGVNVSDTSLTVSDKIVRGDLKMSGAGYDTLDIENVTFKIDEETLSASVCKVPLKWKIVSGDINTVGSEVAIGDEHFYVFGHDNGKVKLLSKYNLYVGNSVNHQWVATPLSNSTGIQDSRAIGFIWDSEQKTVVFPLIGTLEFKLDGCASYSGSLVEEHVNNYASYLALQGANLSSARLITRSELEHLGCDSANDTCDDAPAWVYSTSYWIDYSDNCGYEWFVAKHFGFSGYYKYHAVKFGVRPVIEVPTSEF